jgi:hypothetical protein
MTDPSQPGAFSLAALVPCGGAAGAHISETLLSLAAQTIPALEIHVVVEGGSPSELRGLRDLVGTFDEDFSRRVHVAATDQSGPETAVAFGVARSRATHVSVLYPDDVVFAHWSETFRVNAPRAGGRAMASMVAVQAVDTWTRGEERAVTTIERPWFPDPTGFDLMEHLLSPPLLLRGWALPRQVAHRFLGPGLPVVAEGWALRLAVALSCGVLETGEVTYLGRPSQPAGGSPAVQTGWKSERDAALEVLDRSGITLAPGLLQSVQGSSTHAAVRQLEEELAVLRSHLQSAEEEGRRNLAAAEAGARQREAAMLSSTSWKASAPLRALGEAARRLRRNPGPTPRR